MRRATSVLRTFLLLVRAICQEWEAKKASAKSERTFRTFGVEVEGLQRHKGQLGWRETYYLWRAQAENMLIRREVKWTNSPVQAQRERERTCRLRRSGRTACSQFVETAARLLLCSESEAEQEFFKPYHVHRKKYVSMCCAPLPRHHPLPLRGKKRIELRLIEESTLFNRWPLVSPGWKPG